jgi:hypothetical protein
MPTEFLVGTPHATHFSSAVSLVIGVSSGTRVEERSKSQSSGIGPSGTLSKPRGQNLGCGSRRIFVSDCLRRGQSRLLAVPANVPIMSSSQGKHR